MSHTELNRRQKCIFEKVENGDHLYCKLVVTRDLPVGVFAINVVVERTAVVQDLVAGRAAEALHLVGYS